jgi:hypothetical protein
VFLFSFSSLLLTLGVSISQLPPADGRVARTRAKEGCVSSRSMLCWCRSVCVCVPPKILMKLNSWVKAQHRDTRNKANTMKLWEELRHRGQVSLLIN